VSEQVNSLRGNFQSPHISNFAPLEPQTFVPSEEYIKHIVNVNKRSAKISTSGISIVSMLYGHSRQSSTIGFFSNSWASGL